MEIKEAIQQVNALPEVQAKVYAKAFGFSVKKINTMCSTQELPCRKMGNKSKDRIIDNRPWMVNMIRLKHLFLD